MVVLANKPSPERSIDLCPAAAIAHVVYNHPPRLRSATFAVTAQLSCAATSEIFSSHCLAFQVQLFCFTLIFIFIGYIYKQLMEISCALYLQKPKKKT